MTSLTRLLRIEWLRLGHRWDTTLILIAIPALASLQYVAALSGEIAQMQTVPGVVLPPDLIRLQEMTLARYQFPQSLVTVFVGSAPIVLLGAGLLTVISLGSEFSSATVRTSLIIDGGRSRYLFARMLGSLAIVGAMLVLVTIVSAMLPGAAARFGTNLPSGPALSLTGIGLFFGAYSSAVSCVVVSAGFLTLLLRSPVLAAGTLVGLAVVSSAMEQLTTPTDLSVLLPTAGVEVLLTKAALAAGAVQLPGALRFGDSSAVAIEAAIGLVTLTLAAGLASIRLFSARDVDQ